MNRIDKLIEKNISESYIVVYDEPSFQSRNADKVKKMIDGATFYNFEVTIAPVAGGKYITIATQRGGNILDAKDMLISHLLSLI